MTVILRAGLVVLAIAVLSVGAAAQIGEGSGACSDLFVFGDFDWGGSLNFDVVNAPANSATIVLAGLTPPNGILSDFLGVDLLFPAIPIMAGNTDAMGGFFATLSIPAIEGGPSLDGIELYFQAVSIEGVDLDVTLDGLGDGGFGNPFGMISFCLSNVTTLATQPMTF